MLHFSNSLIVFVCSVNFMYLCSYCATLGKLGGSLGDVSCVSEKDCVPNAYCIDSRFCTCKNNFVQDTATRSCLPKSQNINDTCIIDVQCTSSFGIFAQCYKQGASLSGQCRCVKNAHFQDGLCYESVRLGGSCLVSDNCVSVSNVSTYCAYSQCVCQDKFHPSDDRLDCLPDIALGKPCKKDEECVADHSYCASVCTCQSGYVQSADGSNCLLAAKSLRAACTEDGQCQRYLPNTICDKTDNKCKCIPLITHELDMSCWISASLGEVCSHPNQCTTPSSNRSSVVCSGGRCSCGSGYSRMDADCAKLKDAPGESTTIEKCVFLIVAAVILGLPSTD